LLVLTFLLAFGESAIGLDLVVPGEVGMVLSGAAAESNGTALALVVVAGSLGAIAGDTVGFVLGRRFGVEIASRWRWTRRRIKPSLDRAHRYYADKGGWSVFGARWVGVLRAVVPLVAGSARMPWGRFLAWDAPSAVLWVMATTAAGYLFGSSVAEIVDRMGLWVSVVVIGVIVAVVLVRRWRRRPATEEAS
jgi:membrane protein DedA with SNARE-associated domain